jgi:hypothetical protein
MKTKIFIGLVAAAYIMLGFATGCAKKDNALELRDGGDTLVLNLQRDMFTYTVSDTSNCANGNFWTGTYGNNGGFNASGFHFTHNSGFSIYSYWGGFTPVWGADSLCYTIRCYNGDSCDCKQTNPPCDPADLAGSNGWVLNQWGNIAGHGLDSTYQCAKNAPYLVAYWDYFSSGVDPGSQSLSVTLADNSLFKPLEVYICNHPWPFWGNICGDGFASPFTKDGDHFTLHIHAVKWDGRHDSIPVLLAKYDGGLAQLSTWERVPITNLFGQSPTVSPDSIQSLYFTMKSSDELPGFGPNTAVYFCMDKLKVIDQGAAPSMLGVKATQAVKPAIEVTDHIILTSHTGGEITIHDAKGKEVLRTKVKAGEDKVNLSKLPTGEYRVRHGHRSIPVKKIK